MREALVRELGYGKTSAYERFARQLADLHRRKASQEEIEAAMLEAESAEKAARLFPNVDGVKFLEHGLGCGGTRQDAQALCRLLAGYIHSPNVCGATVLSLGCQHAQVSLLEQEMAALYPKLQKPLLIYEQQKKPVRT
ncbi:MAG: UxaA family hydrolase [Prosthecobacter sp.]